MRLKEYGATFLGIWSRPASTKKQPFTAGCFWGIEAAFRKTDGFVGFTGGSLSDPRYEQVENGTTGPIEAGALVLIQQLSFTTSSSLFSGVYTIRSRVLGREDIPDPGIVLVSSITMRNKSIGEEREPFRSHGNLPCFHILAG
jgi:peptide methionine sulfoxide reductase MsrA